MAKPKHQILIVDDEADMHSVTQLGLRSLKYQGRRCEFLSAYSGSEAVTMMRENPNISVVLLDVVMESDHAGLDACKRIREELGNKFARIILRTGQPGTSPEKETIDNYDLDGYLAKTEITSTKLYSVVRTGLKAWHELMELERHKLSLALINECAMSVHSYDPLETSLNRILTAASDICGTATTVLSLETFDESNVPSHYLMHLTSEVDAVDEFVNRIVKEVNSLVSFYESETVLNADKGVVFPFSLHRELGHGWIYLEMADEEMDELQRQAMYLLCGHAANALYSTVAQGLLSARGEGDDDFDLMTI